MNLTHYGSLANNLAHLYIILPLLIIIATAISYAMQISMSVLQLAAMMMLSVWIPRVASFVGVIVDFQETASHVQV